MVQLQILSRVLQTKDNSLIEDNNLTEDFFGEYKDEYNFIETHVKEYGNVPDIATFLSEFEDVELVDVAETDRYLLNTIREEYLYQQLLPSMRKMADLMQTDSNTAVEYLSGELQKLQPSYDIQYKSLTKSKDRLEQYKKRRENPQEWFFETGFKELDDIIHGIQRSEELFVIVARTNNLKSFVLERICTHVWGLGFNVGYFSPEMSDTSLGFRFDTLFNHYSNTSLMRGAQDIDTDEYEKYLDTLAEKENDFVVTTPKDFGYNPTVSSIKHWIKQAKLDIVAIDGITYLNDERAKRNDSKTVSLTNISEDLMALSVEMHVPILVVVQANRGGVVSEDDGTPELESIRDSDGIAHNASTVISIRYKKDNVLEMGIKKSRNGAVGGRVCYNCDINTGDFVYLPISDNNDSGVIKKKPSDGGEKKKQTAKEDVF